MIDLRGLPSVEELLQTRPSAKLIAEFGRPLTLVAIREVLQSIRNKAQSEITLPSRPAILNEIEEQLNRWLSPTLISVINATGVILHTNLGRAPLSQSALLAIQRLAGEYCSLEFDLKKGERGSRYIHVESLLTRLTGAEAALVVNNNAAAVLLILSVLSNRKNVIISRTQLVEIGGGFRIPDVMRQSGAHLIEIGSTNRVHIEDYELALQQPAGLILRAHHSNFKIVGFTSEPDLKQIVAAAQKYQVPVIDDLGSGTLLKTERFGLAHEPTVQESIEAGVDLVCFSGDKLLGGPQAGIIIGKKVLLDKIKKHPLARAVRADKLCLAALSATLEHYLKDEAERKVPVWQMISTTPEQIQARARRWVEVIGKGEVVSGFSTIGGGSLPEETLPTFLFSVATPQPQQLLTRMRQASPPIIARIESDQVVFDPRTVFPDQEGALLVGIQNVMEIVRE